MMKHLMLIGILFIGVSCNTCGTTATNVNTSIVAIVDAAIRVDIAINPNACAQLATLVSLTDSPTAQTWENLGFNALSAILTKYPEVVPLIQSDWANVKTFISTSCATSLRKVK